VWSFIEALPSSQQPAPGGIVVEEEQLDQQIAYLTRLVVSATAVLVAFTVIIWRVLSEFERYGG
jgi:hypothetical protein